MDFTGLGKLNAYKLNRSLTQEERQRHLKQKQPANADPLDWLSVIKLNSTYLELVDRWYPIKGYAVWFGLMFAVPFVSISFAFIWTAVQKNEVAAWSFGAVAALIFLSMAWVSVLVLRSEAFRLTHYPIRMNRKARQVYAFRPDGSVLTAPWDELFICVVENKLPLGETTHDIRAHVLSEDGKTVKDTFTLGYVDLGNEESALRLWEYIRRYMEAPDGVEQSFRHTELCMPIDGRREGFVFGVIRTFAVAARWPIAQLLASPLFALTAAGRWFAMTTSKIPQWPVEVESACEIAPNDPYRKDWRSNGKFAFSERWWPLICFTVGAGVVVWGVVELAKVALA